MLKKLLTYLSEQIYISNLILNRNTRRITSSLSTNKRILAIVETENSYDRITIYNKHKDNNKVMYKPIQSVDTNNHHLNIESTSVSVNINGNYIAFVDNNLVLLYSVCSHWLLFSHSFSIKPVSKDNLGFNRTVEFITEFSDISNEFLLIYDEPNSVTIISNFEQKDKDKVVIKQHKLNRVKLIVYKLLYSLLFKIS